MYIPIFIVLALVLMIPVASVSVSAGGPRLDYGDDVMNACYSLAI